MHRKLDPLNSCVIRPGSRRTLRTRASTPPCTGATQGTHPRRSLSRSESTKSLIGRTCGLATDLADRGENLVPPFCRSPHEPIDTVRQTAPNEPIDLSALKKGYSIECHSVSRGLFPARFGAFKTLREVAVSPTEIFIRFSSSVSPHNTSTCRTIGPAQTTRPTYQSTY